MPKNGDHFTYLIKLTKHEIDPRSSSKSTFYLNHDIILYSPMKRVTDTLIIKDNYIKMNILKEIPFDLEKMSSKDQWQKHKSNIVREKFKDFFIKDKLLLPRKQIMKEIIQLLQLCDQYKSKRIAVISHSFRLKIIEAYIKTKGEIEKKPELIHYFIQNDKKTFDFGRGFKI